MFKNRKYIYFVLIVMLGVSVSFSYYNYVVNPKSGNKFVEINVTEGQSINSLIPELSSQGVIRSTLLFKLYLKFHKTNLIKPGIYNFPVPASFNEVLKEFSTNPKQYQINFIPGQTLSQLARAVSLLPGHSYDGFLKVLDSGKIRSVYEPYGSNDLEGLLAPNTYYVAPGETNSQIISEMVKEFDKEMLSIGLNPNQTYNGLTAYQVIIIASLARAEAKYPYDEQKVIRVILNRLKLGMPLQLDSTVSYAVGDPGHAPTVRQLQSVVSPYNTYLNKGLPPTPIGAVTIQDVKFVLNPIYGNWLYFVVVTPDGHEAFASTYQEQLYNEKLAQLNHVGNSN